MIVSIFKSVKRDVTKKNIFIFSSSPLERKRKKKYKKKTKYFFTKI